MTGKTVSASEFARRFGHYRKLTANGDIIAVTVRGEVVGGFLSADAMADYHRLRQRERKAFRVEDLPDDLAEELYNGLRWAEYGR